MHAYQPDRLAPQTNSARQFFDALLCHPRLCAGAALSLAVMTLICVNALWYQPGKHPAPLFATRTLDTNSTGQVQQVAALQSQATKKKTNTAAAAAAAEQNGELLREVQTALSVRGYYDGKLDGMYGPRTKRAIQAFQKDSSLPQDGKVSLRLLTQVLLSTSARPQQVPVPNETQTVAVPTKVKTVKVKAIEPLVEPADGLVALGVVALTVGYIYK